MTDQLEDIGAHKGFSTGKEQYRRSVLCKIINQGESLFGCQFTCVILIIGLGITMNAAQVAPLSYIPDDYRFFIF
jgi:hypothetical protein